MASPPDPSPGPPRRVLITGGEGGLAQALVAEFQEGGYEVLAPGRSALDVTDAAQVRAYLGQLDQLDLLVCNAGLTEDALAGKVTLASWQRQLDVNLRGAFLCSQAAIPLLEGSAAGGHIINIGSFSGRIGNAGQTAYASAKAGLVALTQSLALELGPANIRVNCVLPGLLHTKMTKSLPAAAWENARDKHALSRFNVPREAARFIAFLDTLPHTSGQLFQLDSRIAPWT